MTLYEIFSLAINLAILILTALSYLKDRKSYKVKPPFRETVAALFTTLWRRPTESGISFLLIYHQLAFSSNLMQFTQNKKNSNASEQ